MSQADRADARTRTNQRLARAMRSVLGSPAPLPPDATTDMRLRHLEAEVGEVRTRVNALFFAALGSLVLELVGRGAL
jgi:hypothetical protein